MSVGDFESAARLYREAATERPDSAERWADVARAERLAERPERAREAYARVAQLRPDDPRPLIEIGFTYELERRYGQALEQYLAGVTRDPESAYANRVLGTRLLRWGRAEEAVPPLRRAVELQPAHVATWNALALARYHAGDVQAALETFNAALARHPGEIDLRLGRAAILVNTGRHEEALREYDAVLELRPRFAAAHVGRALLLHELGRSEEAVTAFERAVAVAATPNERARYRARLREYRRMHTAASEPPHPPTE